jgi:hypothetical protein
LNPAAKSSLTLTKLPPKYFHHNHRTATQDVESQPKGASQTPSYQLSNYHKQNFIQDLEMPTKHFHPNAKIAIKMASLQPQNCLQDNLIPASNLSAIYSHPNQKNWHPNGLTSSIRLPTEEF